MEIKNESVWFGDTKPNQKASDRKLFLGGLCSITTTNVLIEYFQKYGKIEDAVVMRHQDGVSKGFGFITFSSPEETDSCLQDCPHTVDSKTIDIKNATPRGIVTPIDDEQVQKQKCKLFLGSVSYNTTSDDLQDYFSKYGKIQDCVVMKDSNGMARGFGFVTFSSVEELDECQKHRPHLLNGRTLDTKRASSKESSRSEEGAVTRLFVGGLLGVKITDDLLRECFQKYGTILSVEYERCLKPDEEGRNFAFIQFDDYDAVDKALIDNHTIDGRKVYVAKALPRGIRTPTARQTSRERSLLARGMQLPRMAYQPHNLYDKTPSVLDGIGYAAGNELYGRAIASEMCRSNFDMNGINTASANELFRSNYDNNLLNRAIMNENLRSGIGLQGGIGVQGLNWMDFEDRQSGIQDGAGPIRNRASDLRRRPY